MGAQEFTRASCIAPVRLVNLQPLHDDIRRFRTALDRHGRGTRAFMNSASPGLITAFQANAYYPSHDAYLADPKYFEAHLSLGLLLARSGKHDEARAELLTATTLTPATNPVLRARAYRALARLD